MRIDIFLAEPPVLIIKSVWEVNLMITWQLLPDETCAKVWDNNLLNFPDYNIYQSYAWGQHRANFGWTPLRFMALDQGNNIVAMLQVMMRRCPGNIVLLWGPGGPVGNLTVCNDSLHQKLINETRSKRIYCRISCLRTYQTSDALALRTCAWTRCNQTLNSGLSLYLDLNGEDQFLKGMTKNWRYNLNRSKRMEQSIDMWEEPDIEAIRQVYNSMEEYKGLEIQHSNDDLQSMYQLCKENMITFRCLGSNGEILGIKACAVFGNKAMDLIAANTMEGRKTSASYGLFAALVDHCIKIGVKHYDLNGVDPIANKGVYVFKKEAGAQLLEYLGEWEWSTSNWLKCTFNWAIKRKCRNL